MAVALPQSLVNHCEFRTRKKKNGDKYKVKTEACQCKKCKYSTEYDSKNSDDCKCEKCDVSEKEDGK
jgi:hypothetical protein